MTNILQRRLLDLILCGATLLLGGCVYFNTMYNAGKDYGAAQRSIQEGDVVGARTSMDSVIAKTGRVITKHPDSKYADDAALMKARAEIFRELWESAQFSARFAVENTEDDRIRAAALGLAVRRVGGGRGAARRLDGRRGRLPAHAAHRQLHLRRCATPPAVR